MIWNLAKYLKNEFPLERFYFNTKDILTGDDKVPDRIILVMEYGGTPVPVIRNTTVQIQIICRDADTPKAHALAMSIFTKLDDRYGLILPSNTVDGVAYPQIQTGQISANSEPQSLGMDEQGRPMFTTNFRIIYRR